jgi:spore germination protein GerM
MTRASRFTGPLLALALAAGGCGLPAPGDVDRVDPATVPFGLLDTTAPGAPTAAPRGPVAQVFFVRDQRLVAIPRRVVGENVPSEAVRLLLEGPTAVEAAAGVTSDVPARTRLISLDLTGHVVTVDFTDEFGTVGGSDQVLAVAQLVYTLTASRYIESVRFAINGKPTEVPNGSGSLSSAPRTRHDYRGLGSDN